MVDDGTQYTEVARLRGLAHPLRADLYYRLVALGESTATRLAELVGATPSLVSYHLRELARYGFVESVDETSGDRRDHWWRVIDVGVISRAPQEATGPSRELLEQVEAVHLANQARRLEEFMRSRDEWGVEWAASAFSADFLLSTTPEGLKELYRDLRTVVEKYIQRGSATETPSDSTTVTVLLHGFPVR